MPLLVACSSSARPTELESNLKAVGFDMFIEVPVSDEKMNKLLNILKSKDQEPVLDAYD